MAKSSPSISSKPSAALAGEASPSVFFADVRQAPLNPEVIAAADAVGIAPEAVFAFRDYGDHVVVVTVDGRKLNSAELAVERGDV